MINKAQKSVDDLINKCIELGLDKDMAINCSILHVNQTLFQTNSTQKTILYKDMLKILNKLKTDDNEKT